MSQRRDRLPTPVFLDFPCGSVGKESTYNVGDLGLIPRLGRPPEEGKGFPLQYSGLENSMDCIVHGVTKSQARLSDFHFNFQKPTFAQKFTVFKAPAHPAYKQHQNHPARRTAGSPQHRPRHRALGRASSLHLLTELAQLTEVTELISSEVTSGLLLVHSQPCSPPTEPR